MINFKLDRPIKVSVTCSIMPIKKDLLINYKLNLNVHQKFFNHRYGNIKILDESIVALTTNASNTKIYSVVKSNITPKRYFYVTKPILQKLVNISRIPNRFPSTVVTGYVQDEDNVFIRKEDLINIINNKDTYEDSVNSLDALKVIIKAEVEKTGVLQVINKLITANIGKKHKFQNFAWVRRLGEPPEKPDFTVNELRILMTKPNNPTSLDELIKAKNSLNTAIINYKLDRKDMQIYIKNNQISILILTEI